MGRLDGKNALVTGGAGFIGSHLCDCLLKEPVSKVVSADNLFLGKESNHDDAKTFSNFIFKKADVTDFESIEDIIESQNIDIIYHLAVIPLEVSLENPDWCFDQNIKMTRNILEIIRQSKRDIKLIAYSSSEVYGTALYTPMDEEHPLLPHTPYAASKAASDQLVYSYYQTFRIDAVIVRPFNNYGPRQNEGNYAGIVPLTIKRILNGEKPVIYDDGQQTRDFIYVKETADWTVKISKMDNIPGQIINLASGKQITIESVIKTICSEMGYSGDIEYRKKRPGDVRKHEGSVEKAKKLFNFESKTCFRKGIVDTVNWYKNNAVCCSL